MQNNEVIFLQNNQPRVFHLPGHVRKHSGQLAGETVATAVVDLGDGKPIPPSAPREKDGKPRLTAVDKAYWDELCKPNAQVQTWLRKGWLSIVTDEDVGGDLEIEGLDNLNVKTAITCVEGESNPRLLSEWLKTETRPEVKASITARLDFVSKKDGKNLPPLGRK